MGTGGKHGINNVLKNCLLCGLSYCVIVAFRRLFRALSSLIVNAWLHENMSFNFEIKDIWGEKTLRNSCLRVHVKLSVIEITVLNNLPNLKIK